jgi:hypothetical protein
MESAAVEEAWQLPLFSADYWRTFSFPLCSNP